MGRRHSWPNGRERQALPLLPLLLPLLGPELALLPEHGLLDHADELLLALGAGQVVGDAVCGLNNHDVWRDVRDLGAGHVSVGLAAVVAGVQNAKAVDVHEEHRCPEDVPGHVGSHLHKQ